MLVDDHEIVRAGLRMLLEAMEDYIVVCEAGNGKAALEKLKIQEVELILLDLQMPIMDGLTFLEKYQGLQNTVPVVVLTTVDDQDRVKRAIELGAKSYLLKDSSRETLDRTIKAALNDEMLLTSTITSKLLMTTPSKKEEAQIQSFGLTDKEMYVLGCVAKGDTNRGIAIELGISERTVKAHLTQIYQKMDVNSRSEAVAKAMANKVIGS